MATYLADATKDSLDAAFDEVVAGDTIKIAPGTMTEYQAPRNINFALTIAPQQISNPPTLNGWNGSGNDPKGPGNFRYVNLDTGNMSNVTWDGLIFYARRITSVQKENASGGGSTTRTLRDDPDGTGYGWRVDQAFDPNLVNLSDNAGMRALRMGGPNCIVQNCVFNGFSQVLSVGTRGTARHNLYEQNCEDIHFMGGTDDATFEYNLIERFRGVSAYDANRCWTWNNVNIPPHSDCWQMPSKTTRLIIRRNVVNDTSGRMHGILMQLSQFFGPDRDNPANYHVDPTIEGNYFALSHGTGMLIHHCNRLRLLNNKVTKVGSVDTPVVEVGITDNPDNSPGQPRTTFQPDTAPNSNVQNNRAPQFGPRESNWDDFFPITGWTWANNDTSNTSFPDPWVEIRKDEGGAADTEWAGPYGKATDPGGDVPPSLDVPSELAFDHNATTANAEAPVNSWNSYIKIPDDSPAYDADSVEWALEGSTTRNAAVLQSALGPNDEQIYRLSSTTKIHWHRPGDSFTIGVYYRQPDNAVLSERSEDLTITITGDEDAIVEAEYADFATNYRVYASDGTPTGVREIMEVYDWTGRAFQKPAPFFTGYNNPVGATMGRASTPNAVKVGSYVVNFCFRASIAAPTPPTPGGSNYLAELDRIDGLRGCSGIIMGGFATQNTAGPGSYTGNITSIRQMSAAFDDVDPLDPVEDSALMYNAASNLTVNVPALTVDAAALTNYRILMGLSGAENNTYPEIPGFTLIRDSNSLPHMAMYYSTWPVTAFGGMAITTTGANTNSVGFVIALRLKKLGTGALLAPILVGTLDPWTFAAGSGPYTYGTSIGFHGTSIVYSLPTGATGLTIEPNTGIIIADSTLTTAGVKSLVVRATNATGSVDQPLTLTVTGVTIPVTVGTIGPWNVGSASGIQTFNAAVGFSGAALAYSLQTGSTGVSIDPVTGIVSADTSVTTVGTKSLVVRAANTAGGVNQPLSLVVSAIAPPTTVGTLGPLNLNASSGVQTLATAGGFAGTGISYSLVSPPSGYSIHSSTGLLSIDTAVATSASLTVRATNATPPPANQPLTVTVLPVPVAVGTLAAWNEVQNTGSKTYATAGGFSGSGLSYALVTSLTGLSINTTTGVLTMDTATFGTVPRSRTIRATNAAGSADQVLNMTVTVANKVNGGTKTEVNIGGVDYVVHTVNDTGTLDILAAGNYDLLYCASGGSGGSGPNSSTIGGSGGAGGFLIRSNVALTVGAYTVTIGEPGAAPAGGGVAAGNDGGDLVAFGTTVQGGGGGGGAGSATGINPGRPGGSGGGGASRGTTSYAGGAGTAGQGFSGGANFPASIDDDRAAGGGGGAGGAGGAAAIRKGGNGGAGVTSNFDGVSRVYSPGASGGVAQVGVGLAGTPATGGATGADDTGVMVQGTAPGAGGPGCGPAAAANLLPGIKGVFKLRYVK